MSVIIASQDKDLNVASMSEKANKIYDKYFKNANE